MPAAARPVITYATSDSPALEATHLAYDAALHTLRDDLGRRYPMRIGGTADDGIAWLEDRSPAEPETIVARVAVGTARHADAAVTAGRRAFKEWSRWPLSDRLAVLRRTADRIEESASRNAAVLSLEVGKPRVEAFAEASELPTLIRYYCDVLEEADGYGRPPQVAPGAESARMLLRPYGVWAVISPFNFPLATGAGMAVGALVAGNTVVMKPASEAPLPTLGFAEALEQAGAPAGTISVVVGDARAVGSPLVEHPEISGVAFTGSVETGRAIARALADAPIRRPFIAELGGKNPVIVSSSADLGAAVEGVIRSAFGFSGQKCSATSRVFVLDDVCEAFVEQLAAATASLVVGDPTERGVSVGPVIDERAVARFLDIADLARRDGRVVVGGRRLADRAGFFVEPTVVADLPLGHRVFRDELFLPLVAVGRVASFEDGLREANAVDFGLCAGLFSRDEREVERFFDEMEAGVLYANRRSGATSGAWPGIQSFTGWKASGSTGKGALGPWYVQQFLREQAQTSVADAL